MYVGQRTCVSDVPTKRSGVRDMREAARREVELVVENLQLADRPSDTQAEPDTQCCAMCIFPFFCDSRDYYCKRQNKIFLFLGEGRGELKG